MNAAECLSATERRESPYRSLAFTIAAYWLSLARHQDAMDGLLTIWSKAQSAAPIRAAAFLALRGTPGQMGNCLKGGQHNREIFMSCGTCNRANTADRYRQIAAEYAGLSKDTADPFFRPYYLWPLLLRTSSRPAAQGPHTKAGHMGAPLPYGVSRGKVPLTAGSFHIWESQESGSRRVGISYLP
jgi:hypothetical protein